MSTSNNVGTMEINMPAGASEVTLRTGGKYCEKDIRVTSPSSYRVLTGTHKINTTTKTNVEITVPCSTAGLKAFVVYPNETTLASIKTAGNTDKLRYFCAIIGNFYASDLGTFNVETVTYDSTNKTYSPVYGLKAIQICLYDMTAHGLGWVPTQDQATCEVVENGIKFTARAALAGDYCWRAYYWNE